MKHTRCNNKHKKSIRRVKNNKYTAMIPRTVKAVKYVGTYTVKKSNFLLNKITRSVKNISKNINSRTANIIRSVTRKRK